MCAYYMSPIYQDVTAKLLTRSGSVCLSLSSGKDDAVSVHITLNPMQARALGKYLQTIRADARGGNRRRQSLLRKSDRDLRQAGG